MCVGDYGDDCSSRPAICFIHQHNRLQSVSFIRITESHVALEMLDRQKKSPLTQET